MSEDAAILLKVGVTMGAVGIIFGVLAMFVLALGKKKDNDQ